MRAPESTNQIVPPFLLVGEGNDEVSLLRSLSKCKPELFPATPDIEQFGEPRFGIEETEGKDNLKSYLHKLTIRSGYEKLTHLAIFRDADQNRNAAYDSVKGHVRSILGVELPKTYKAGGVWSVPSKEKELSVGVFIFHGSLGTGMLEDLYLEIIRDQNVDGQDCIDTFVECIRIHKPEDWAHFSKAKTLATYALLNPKNHFLANAFKPSYFDHPVMQPMLKFLKGLEPDQA